MIRTGSSPRVEASLNEARPMPFWLDSPDRPPLRDPLGPGHDAGLVIIGGGFSGLWTAVLAKERDPGRHVVLLESNRIGWAATGRNGGFCAPSLTHGYENGLHRFPTEIERLESLGSANLNEIEDAVNRYGIDCDFQRPGSISVATSPHQVEGLRSARGEFLDDAAVRSRIDSPTYLAGLYEPSTALVNPARLAWGLADVAERLGVVIHEQSAARSLRRGRNGIEVTTQTGHMIRARKVALGTNAFPSLLRRLRLYTVPVYDYVLVTEPLSKEQLATIGWSGREGVDDVANQFHYYRMTADDRILWGGYDAIYHYGRRIEDRFDQRPATFKTLASHFFDTFPQLEDLRFTHKWGGAIDTCTRFCAFYGSALNGDVAYSLGYTGLGVSATRFGAQVVLDLLDGAATERTGLELVRTKPTPFPPEPFAYTGIQATRAALAAADRNAGRRNAWLRALDLLGLGFDT